MHRQRIALCTTWALAGAHYVSGRRFVHDCIAQSASRSRPGLVYVLLLLSRTISIWLAAPPVTSAPTTRCTAYYTGSREGALCERATIRPRLHRSVFCEPGLVYDYYYYFWTISIWLAAPPITSALTTRRIAYYTGSREDALCERATIRPWLHR